MNMLKVTGLVWGLKESFRNYVEATGGVIATEQGAERSADGSIAFTPKAGEELRLDGRGKPQGQGSFSGSMKFQSHGGMLSIHLADPTIEVSDTGASLTVAVEGGSHRLEIARLDLSAISQGEANDMLIPAALSMDAYQLLDSQYPPGTVLDPVRLICASIES